jgi:hypothetical protein
LRWRRGSERQHSTTVGDESGGVLQHGEATRSVRCTERRRKTHRGGALTEVVAGCSVGFKSSGAGAPPTVGDRQEAMGRSGAHDVIKWERNGRGGIRSNGGRCFLKGQRRCGAVRGGLRRRHTTRRWGGSRPDWQATGGPAVALMGGACAGGTWSMLKQGPGTLTRGP